MSDKRNKLRALVESSPKTARALFGMHFARDWSLLTASQKKRLIRAGWYHVSMGEFRHAFVHVMRNPRLRTLDCFLTEEHARMEARMGIKFAEWDPASGPPKVFCSYRPSASTGYYVSKLNGTTDPATLVR